jgi:hypothetical protein
MRFPPNIDQPEWNVDGVDRGLRGRLQNGVVKFRK